MTNLDTPDGQRGTVAAQHLLAAVVSPTVEVTVPVAPNVDVLWIFGEGIIAALPTAVGVTSGYAYPVFAAPWASAATDSWFSAVAVVTGALDAEVTITWLAEPATHWWVVADTGGRFTVDAALAAAIQTPGQRIPESAVQVAGSDGTDTRVLLTDAAGKLQVTAAAFPAVYGAPGAAAPVDALQVAGTDGTDLRALLTDAAGRQLTIDQLLKLAIAALGGTVPADAVLVAGSDGVHLQALSVGTTGVLLTDDQTISAMIAHFGTALPAIGLPVAGTDGTDSRALRTDQQGAQYAIPTAPSTLTGDRPPVELSWASLVGVVASTVIIAAPGAGKAVRLFYVAGFAFNGAANYYVQCFAPGGGNVYPCVSEVPAGLTPPPSTLPLTGLLCETNTAVTLGLNAGSAGATVGYTIETV